MDSNSKAHYSGDPHYTPTKDANQIKNNDKPTFSDKVKQSKTNKNNEEITFPTNEQAIIINSIDETPLMDYIKKLCEIIPPKDILSASKISKNRICFYLSSKNLVDRLINNNTIIELKNTKLEIRRLITPVKRIIISNVYHSVPHSVIELAIQQTGLKMVSPINFLRIGTDDNELSHIVSFRRQVYVADLGKINIPETLLINHDRSEYRIFLSEDNPVCLRCKKQGHRANNCDTIPTNSENLPENDKPMNKNILEQNQKTPIETIQQNDTKPTNTEEKIPPPESSQKTPEDTTTQNIPEQTEKTEADIKQRPKRARSISPENTPAEVEKILKIELSKNPSKYLLNYEKFKDFIENASGSTDPLSVSRDYTSNTTGLIEMIEKLHTMSKNKSFKNRFTRIKNKISLQLAEESGEGEDQEMI